MSMNQLTDRKKKIILLIFTAVIIMITITGFIFFKKESAKREIETLFSALPQDTRMHQSINDRGCGKKEAGWFGHELTCQFQGEALFQTSQPNLKEIDKLLISEGWLRDTSTTSEGIFEERLSLKTQESTFRVEYARNTSRISLNYNESSWNINISVRYINALPIP